MEKYRVRIKRGRELFTLGHIIYQCVRHKKKKEQRQETAPYLFFVKKDDREMG